MGLLILKKKYWNITGWGLMWKWREKYISFLWNFQKHTKFLCILLTVYLNGFNLFWPYLNGSDLIWPNVTQHNSLSLTWPSGPRPYLTLLPDRAWPACTQLPMSWPVPNYSWADLYPNTHELTCTQLPLSWPAIFDLALDLLLLLLAVTLEAFTLIAPVIEKSMNIRYTK